MSNELTMAAERLRRMKNTNDFTVAYSAWSNHRTRYGAWEADKALVIDTYLAEHPDPPEGKLKWRPISELPKLHHRARIDEYEYSDDLILWLHGRAVIGSAIKCVGSGDVLWGAANHGGNQNPTHWCEITPPATETE